MKSFNLKQLPQRTAKPRENGITMVMDKGLSVRETEDLLSVSGKYFDLVKFGFGTAVVTEKLLKEKIKLYQTKGIRAYFGGTLFEAFLIRKQVDNYLQVLRKFKLDCVEISDGSIEIAHEKKCELIRKFSKDFTVISEVGSKDSNKHFPPRKWIEMIKKELNSGSWKVIAEGRESGNVGVYNSDGDVHGRLVHRINAKIEHDKIIWETPLKSQQVFFIKQLDVNVNLGNIAPNDVIPLETLRLGLRSDTFHHFLDKK
ncbi:MAG: phosphosulfolactate synthase [Bacteroidia bacterium]